MKITQVLLILFLPITIIFSNLLFLTNNNNFYQTIYKKENVYQNFQSIVQVNNATKELIGYFRGQNNLEDNIYSIQAKSHLKDVKSLIHTASLVNSFSIFIVGIAALLFLMRKKYKLLKKSIIIGSSITIFIILISSISLLINFDFLFIKFHEVLFKNNLWLFPENDNLIKLFPTSFFTEFTKQLLINIFISVFILLCLVYLLPKDDSKTN